MALGTPPQTFEFSVDNGVLAFTMVDDAQPIICDGFSSTGDAKVSGNPASNIETDEGNDAGAAAGAVIAVIVARRVRSLVLGEPQSPTHPPHGPAGRLGRSWFGRQRVPAPLILRLPPLRLSSASALAATGI